MSRGNVLVIGASGLVGSALVPAFLARGWQVTATLRESGAGAGLEDALEGPPSLSFATPAMRPKSDRPSNAPKPTWSLIVSPRTLGAVRTRPGPMSKATWCR